MMGQTWKTHIIILIAMNFPKQSICSPLDETRDSMNYPDLFVYPDEVDDNQLDKRLGGFVRIGRGLSSFIRIGKNDPGFAGYDLETDDGNADENDFQKRNSAFVRIGRGGEPEADKRLSSFVRIGKSGDETEPYFAPLDKRGGAFIRLGKFPSAAFVRNRSGKIHSIASPPYYRRSGRIGHSSFIRIGKRDTRDALRQEKLKSYLNYNQGNVNTDRLTEPTEGVSTGNEKRMSSFVRIGRQGNGYIPDDLYGKPMYSDLWPSDEAKRMSKFVRIGKDATGDDMYKRMSSFVRIGKNYGPTNDKRLSSFVRIGKSNTDDLLDRNDKRMSKFVRIGKAMEVPNEDFNAEKRRLSKFAGIPEDLENLSNSVDETDREQDKRMSSFVRIGKSDNDKRMSSFVRIGRASDTNNDDAIQMDNSNDLLSDDGLGNKAE